MNKVILMGRLTRDPEVRYTQGGKVVCQFTLAVDRFTTNSEGQREADFVPIVVWGKVGELCGNSLTKGSRALVDGRLQIRIYEAKDGSGKRWVTEVIASAVQFLDRKADSKDHQAHGEPSAMDGFGSQMPFDEEIPF
ncbi:MAG: single-stranded DNA-binding protein [Acidaminococcaceae bacterium]